MSKLEERIIEKGKIEVQSILDKGAIDAQKLYEKLISDAQKDFEVNLEKQTSKKEAEVSRLMLDAKRSLRDEVAIAKQNLIETIFSNVTKYLSELSKEDLFTYVVKSIQSETLVGDEIIVVSKKDYQTYLSIFSTQKGDLVECDLLNSKLGTKFHLKLSNKPAKIDNGFIVLGTDYDLNFSFEDTIERLKSKYEKNIYEALN